MIGAAVLFKINNHNRTCVREIKSKVIKGKKRNVCAMHIVYTLRSQKLYNKWFKMQ